MMHISVSNYKGGIYDTCRFLRKAVRGWVLWWYRQASGMLIAARHRQLLAATAVQALRQNVQQRNDKYALWRAAARQRLRMVFGTCHRLVACPRPTDVYSWTQRLLADNLRCLYAHP